MIATVPRSGSWLLADVLESTGCCGHPREYFRADYQPRYAAAWGLGPATPIERYIERAVAVTSTPNGVFAVKLHWGQLVHLAGQLRDEPGGALKRCLPRARYVFLTRADKLRQAISLQRAVRSDTWWTLAGEDDPANAAAPAVTPPSPEDLAEVARLERVLGEHDACWRTLLESGRFGDPLEIGYGALAADYAATALRVLEFLGVPAQAVPPPRLQRQADAMTDAWVAAYRERDAARTAADLRV